MVTPGGWYCPECFEGKAKSETGNRLVSQCHREMLLTGEDIGRMLADSPDLCRAGLNLTPTHRIRLSRHLNTYLRYRRSLG